MHSALPTTGTNMPLRPGLILARTMLPIIEDWDTDSDNDSEVPKESSKDAVADDAGKKTNKEPANEGERNGQEKEGGALNKEDDQNVQDFRAALDNLLIFHRSFSFLRFEDTVSYSGAYDDGMMGRVTPKKKALINEELLPPVARIKDNQVYKVERPDMVLYSAPRALFQVTPKVLHLHAVRYLKSQPKLGLWYPRDLPFDLEAFYDSDYVGARLDRKSTTGGCEFLGKRLISWQCKKQTIVANSTTEAEYVAAANCCGHVLWIQNQMLD
ncbi:hypothetical protein Tco_0925891 [Tanacetum coccineum]|uniref:Uncharacterized protein n=1 Tax=Tanacetum coccineum TaxID=301880 RepID=A0ABQ5D946_9ASTR